jgi:hypothetical protein
MASLYLLESRAREPPNDDLIRNAAYCWSPMTAKEIEEKTGIVERLYTELDLDHISLLAAQRALEKSGRRPEEIGAVIFCPCTSAKMMPPVTSWPVSIRPSSPSRTAGPRRRPPQDRTTNSDPPSAVNARPNA